MTHEDYSTKDVIIIIIGIVINMVDMTTVAELHAIADTTHIRDPLSLPNLYKV